MVCAHPEYLGRSRHGRYRRGGHGHCARILVRGADTLRINCARCLVPVVALERERRLGTSSSGQRVHAGLSAVDDGSGGVHLVYKDSAEELRYRHYDGASWGSPQLIESAADWALQPAITRVGTTIVIFWNRMIAANTDYQVYYRTLSNGSLSAPQLLDGTGGFKGYPAAAETLPSTVPTVACAYGNTPDAS